MAGDNEGDTVYLLWEKPLSEHGQAELLLGVYSNKEAADEDAAMDSRWFVQSRELDHEPVVDRW